MAGVMSIGIVGIETPEIEEEPELEVYEKAFVYRSAYVVSRPIRIPTDTLYNITSTQPTYT